MGKRLEAAHEIITIAHGNTAQGGLSHTSGSTLKITQRDQFRQFIERAGEPVTVAEIMEALNIDLDETAIVCAQLKMMTTRVKEGLGRTVLNGKWAYYVKTMTTAKPDDFLDSEQFNITAYAYRMAVGDAATPFEVLKQLIRDNVGNIHKR